MASTLDIVCCHFNPCGFRKPIDNFFEFRDSLNRRVTAVEISFDGNFLVADEPQDIRIDADPDLHCLWQGERCFNIGARRMRSDRLAWLDADIIFDNPFWYEEACRQLDKYPAVQLFGRAVRPGMGEPCDPVTGETYASLSAAHKHTLEPAETASDLKAHPGLAWAARKDAFERGWEQIGGGLIETQILGGGDWLMLDSWLGHQGERHKRDVGYVSGTIHHLPHGSLKNRRYDERYTDLHAAGFHFHEHIENCERTGLLRWTDSAPAAVKDTVRDYFLGRMEDS